VPDLVPPPGNAGSPFADLRGHHVALRTPSLHHFCVHVDSVDATLAELRARGVEIVEEPFLVPAISRRLAFVADPFGNLIELSEVVD